VFTRDADQRASFRAASPPAIAELEAIVVRVRDRALAWLRRRGLLDERPAEERSNEAPEPAALEACAAIAMQRGTHATLPLPSEEGGAEQDVEAPRAQPALAFERDGFNLHAGVRIEAGDDVGRERLCRYGARPPLSLERLRRLPGGRFAYRVKYARRGRAKHRVMTSMELLARLAALIPPPRYPLVRYSGVLAPRSAWRKDVVPKPRVGEVAKACEPRQARSETERSESERARAPAPPHAGRLQGKPPCAFIAPAGDVVVGPCFVAAMDDEGEPRSLTDAEITVVLKAVTPVAFVSQERFEA
jgi:hypothetical protein